MAAKYWSRWPRGPEAKDGGGEQSEEEYFHQIVIF